MNFVRISAPVSSNNKLDGGSGVRALGFNNYPIIFSGSIFTPRDPPPYSSNSVSYIKHLGFNIVPFH